MDLAMRKALVDTAAGRRPADLVLRGASYVNVFTGEIGSGDIAVCGRYIAGVGGSYEGKEVKDLTGKVLIPGLTDSHIHLESSMVRPSEFARAVIPHGTTAVITDPHELANVAGIDGISYILEMTEKLPLDVFVMLPSCVPCDDVEDTAEDLEAASLTPLYDHPRVLGLAEMMRYLSTVEGDEDILRKIDDAAKRGLRVDGHAPGLSGQLLGAYAAAGVASDHECSTLEEALEKIRMGQYVMIREGTAAHNQEALAPLLNRQTAYRCLLCCDDRHPSDLLEDGHMDHNLRLAVRQGADPIAAIRAASLIPAQYFGLPDRGAVAPGYLADLVAVDDLQDFRVEAVYKNGKAVYADGQAADMDIPVPEPSLDARIHDTFRLAAISEKTFQTEGDLPVIGMVPRELITTDAGLADEISVEQDILKIAVLERHQASGRTGLGYIKGYGLQAGAVATSVSHDAHNVIVVGCNEKDMAAAVRQLEKDHGGIAVARDGEILAALPLPVGGLMSDEMLETVNEKLEYAKTCARQLGVAEGVDPFMTLSFMSLPVIPELRITTRGVYRVGSE